MSTKGSLLFTISLGHNSYCEEEKEEWGGEKNRSDALHGDLSEDQRPLGRSVPCGTQSVMTTSHTHGEQLCDISITAAQSKHTDTRDFSAASRLCPQQPPDYSFKISVRSYIAVATNVEAGWLALSVWSKGKNPPWTTCILIIIINMCSSVLCKIYFVMRFFS